MGNPTDEILTQEGADVVQSLWRAAQARGVWTTERPTKSGWYWAMEDADPLDADIYAVWVFYNDGRLQATALGVTFELSDLSHFMTLERPEPPYRGRSYQELADNPNADWSSWTATP